MAQFGYMNNGIRVRDPSQMFMFGDTRWVHESAGLLTKNKSQQAGVFGKPFVGNQSSGSVDQNLAKKEDDNMFKVAAASSRDENPPKFNLTPTSQSQIPPVNRFNPFKFSQQMVKKEDGQFKKLSQSFKSVKNQLSNQKVVSVKKKDGQRWSTRPTNICLGSPVKQNIQKFSVTGSCELPSTSYAANTRRIRKRSNTRSLESKKRKFSTFQQNKVTEGSSRLHDVSTAELKWAHSVARLPEKFNELAEDMKDSGWMVKRKRRLILTTQLMQMLFQPPPANVLSADAITHCDVVTYYASKLASDRVCSLRSLARKSMASKSKSEHDLLEVIEGFIDRSKKLEADVLRLEKGESMMQVMMASQALEKVTFINRFATFHTRTPMVTRNEPSTTMPKVCPQVKAIPMPKTVPKGQNCLFL